MPGKGSRKRIARIVAGVLAAVGVAFVGCGVFIYSAMRRDSFAALFDENCGVCHGEQLEGAPQGTPLVGVDLIHGDSVDQISLSIAEGSPQRGMPAWSGLGYICIS